MEPVVKALSEDGMPYQGILYAGLMLTSQGPQVLEFNCRLGDPEAQVILPILKTDLVDVALASIRGELGKLSLQWDEGGCVGVVMASNGYGIGKRKIILIGKHLVVLYTFHYHLPEQREWFHLIQRDVLMQVLMKNLFLR